MKLRDFGVLTDENLGPNLVQWLIDQGFDVLECLPSRFAGDIPSSVVRGINFLAPIAPLIHQLRAHHEIPDRDCWSLFGTGPNGPSRVDLGGRGKASEVDNEPASVVVRPGEKGSSFGGRLDQQL